MLKNKSVRALRLFVKFRSIFEAGSAKWWPGLALITVSIAVFIALFVLAEIVFVGQLLASGWHEAMPKISAVFVSVPIGAGVLMLIKRLRSKHEDDPYYIVVKTARFGYWTWVLLTTLVCMMGLIFLLTGISPLSGAAALFSLAFLVIGTSLAERPHMKMNLSSLLLLKRIANWQLLAGSAVIALIYETPSLGGSILIRLEKIEAYCSCS